MTCDQWVHVAGNGEGEDHWTVSPDGKVVTYHHETTRRGLYDPTDQDLESLEITKERLTNRRVTTVFGKDDQNLEFVDGWRSPGDVPAAVQEDWVGTTEFQLKAEEAVVSDPVDVPRQPTLNANSRVADLKARLKQLGAPVWGDKARLWSRLQEYEARNAASRNLEAQLQLREEELRWEGNQWSCPCQLRPAKWRGSCMSSRTSPTHLGVKLVCEEEDEICPTLDSKLVTPVR